MGDYTDFGGPFRFLTIWALFCSFFAASRMLALEEGRSSSRWDGFVCMTAVINAMVVVLFWRLYVADPMSVTDDGQLGRLYLEVYLHGAGPALQIIDTLFLHRSYQNLRAPLLWLFAVIGCYIAWSELVVAPMNSSPAGRVTSGLPYRFLNDLELPERAIFYASHFAIALVVVLVFAGLAKLIRRTFQPQTTP